MAQQKGIVSWRAVIQDPIVGELRISFPERTDEKIFSGWRCSHGALYVLLPYRSTQRQSRGEPELSWAYAIISSMVPVHDKAAPTYHLASCSFGREIKRKVKCQRWLAANWWNSC